MEGHVKADDHHHSLADKAKDALHHAADKTKELAQKVKDAVTGGGRVSDDEMSEAEEELAEVEDRIRRNKLEETYLHSEKAKAAEKLAHYEEEHSNGVDEEEGVEVAEFAERERFNTLRAQLLEQDKLRAEEKITHLKQKQEEYCHGKHRETTENDLSNERPGTSQTIEID